MSNKNIKLLLATRAMESPPYEGGFVLLSDIAGSVPIQTIFELSMFSVRKKSSTINAERVFSKTGWGNLSKLQFPIGLWRTAHKYRIVHTAHIPSKNNVQIIKFSITRARTNGTKFIQTITGLPRVDNEGLKALLWGDSIVCQSPSVYERVCKISDKPVHLIIPWPSPKRLKFASINRQKTRNKFLRGKEHLVVFPGEFERMAIGTDFSECLKEFFILKPNSLVVLACRFDNIGVADRIVKKFPGQVVSLGQTSNIIDIIGAADLVLFPTKKMDEKFHPPLIIMEALSLGVPTLISDKIDLNESVSNLLKKISSEAGWKEFARVMHSTIETTGFSGENSTVRFDKMIKAYKKLYGTYI